MIFSPAIARLINPLRIGMDEAIERRFARNKRTG